MVNNVYLLFNIWHKLKMKKFNWPLAIVLLGGTYIVFTIHWMFGICTILFIYGERKKLWKRLFEEHE